MFSAVPEAARALAGEPGRGLPFGPRDRALAGLESVKKTDQVGPVGVGPSAPPFQQQPATTRLRFLTGPEFNKIFNTTCTFNKTWICH
jgi:hypothetical protein